MLFRFWVFPDCTFLDISTMCLFAFPESEANLKIIYDTAIRKKSDWQNVQQILDEKPLPGKSARLHAMPKRFTVTRSKDKYFRGYIILDPRWTASERRELLKELKNL